MRYEIKGDSLPVLICKLEAGEQVICEGGGMSWMDDEIEMETKGGGIGKMFGRMLTGESMFLNRYTARRAGEIAFASSFPGSIRAVEVKPGNPIIAQKSAFLAAFGNVDISVFFHKRFKAGFFGGEGFLMQKFEGNGIVFLEIDGTACEYYIPEGDKKIVSTGYVAMMDGTCRIDSIGVKGVKNALFGGEGLFNTVVYGPGNVVLQSMPISQVAALIAPVSTSSS